MKIKEKNVHSLLNESVRKVRRILDIKKTIQKIISATNLTSIIISIFGIFLLLYQLRVVDKNAFLTIHFHKIFLSIIVLYTVIIIWQMKKTDTSRFIGYVIQSLLLIGIYFYSKILGGAMHAKHFWIMLGIAVYIWVIISTWSSLLYSSLTPSQIVAFSFMFVIIMGALMLYLPASTKKGNMSFIDALFMATSAVCVTGLSVFDIGKNLTFFGQVVMLSLIQIGGIGIMTFSVLFIQILGARVSINDRIRNFGLFDINTKYKPKHIVYTIIITTFLIEIIGAAVLYANFNSISHGNERLYAAIFHSVSAFCNAGFSIFSDNLYSFIDNYPVVLTICFLIIFGGIGFIVMFHIFLFVLRKFTQFINFPIFKIRNTIQIKIVITTTLSLLIFGTVFILFNEYNNSFRDFPIEKKIITAFFSSVTPRTAGFEIMPIALFKDVSKLCIMFLMFVGASAGSTGGGIKTTTFFVLIYSLVLVVKNKSYIAINGRRIAEHLVNKAVAVTTIAVIVCLTSTYAIYLLQPELPLFSIAYECISALSTVGLSLGITTSLSSTSKIIIIFLMYVGRIGYLTILMSIGHARNDSANIIDIPSEDIMIG